MDFTILGTLYRSECDSAGVAVLLNVVLCVVLAVAYFYSPYVPLPYQIGINLFWMAVSLAGIFKIDLSMRLSPTVNKTDTING